MNVDSALLQDWIGHQRQAEDIVTPRLLASLRATLGTHIETASQDIAPPGFHWCLAPDLAEGTALGRDGHPAKGTFLPPVALPRRMWAASEVRFIAPISCGDFIRRRSTICTIEEKHGRTGPLVFVTVRHDLENSAGPLVEDVQTIVYRETSTGPHRPTWTPHLEASHERSVDIDTVLLFRYSALTFNSHRIHYDAAYASRVEHYPGLVIHGPLQATLLMNFAAAVAGKAPQRFAFRAVGAATGAQRLTLRATETGSGEMAMEVIAASGDVTMKATAGW